MDKDILIKFGNIEATTQNTNEGVKRIETVVVNLSEVMEKNSHRLRDVEEKIRNLAKWQTDVSAPLKDVIDMQKKVKFSIDVMKFVGAGTGLLIIKTVIEWLKP